MQKTSYKISLITLLFSVGGVLLFHVSPFFGDMKGKMYDVFEQQSLRYERVRDDIVIVGVDKKTLEYFGQQGSWSRSYYEWLLHEIESHHPKAVAFDYLFTSKDRPEKVDWDVIEKLSWLGKEKTDALFDAYHATISGSGFISTIDTDFAGAMKKYGNVALPSVLKTSSTGAILGIDRPFEVYNNAAHIGYANPTPDSDGIIRSFIPRMDAMDSFALGIANIWTDKIQVPTNKQILINYHSRPHDRYPVVPFYKAYNGIWEDYAGRKVDPKGKILLIGDYDESLGDTYQTPVSDGNVTPGVEIVANEVTTLLNQDTVSFPEKTQGMLLLVSLTLCSLLLFWSVRSFVTGLVVLILVSVSFFLLDLYTFLHGWYLDYITILLSIVLPYLTVYAFRIWRTIQDKKRVERIFARHVDRSIVDALMQDDTSSLGASERREVTVFFSDIEGFTTISERLSPELVVQVLNHFFHIVNGVILKNHGTINKYIGDAVLAFWWAPLRHDNHALATCTTALLIQKTLREHAHVFEKDTGAPLNIRFGITTGEVTVGNIGDARFSDYTIVGDSVNLASRLEGVNKIYHTNIILSEATAERVAEHFILRKLDRISVKGKTESTTIYELMGFSDSPDKNLYERIVKNHDRALKAYFKQDWDTARNYFSENFGLHDYVATVFLERIRLFESNPLAPDWDGVYRLQDK